MSDEIRADNHTALTFEVRAQECETIAVHLRRQARATEDTTIQAWAQAQSTHLLARAATLRDPLHPDRWSL